MRDDRFGVDFIYIRGGAGVLTIWRPHDPGSTRFECEILNFN